ncbi:FKBP-type peptidyl-prolyl cis-trans isomerase [Rodentibacter pneumotropicus]|nr:FKBP-type peptidyl-prolyl cis-trans isomerase [Rodentibacter pneumotropicus]MDC2826015.1 FKBP-type peptidyl-prolyl cis-trans isomerase [Rodentibacter pneumotropicus]NBH75560.1 FKBP-type peptidyl-prolyl cis-trans isomerase [Rodentibacter pneumotropicus]OOF61235.1 peptidylprolyl isomerase [Rodentibacter pneumotropicus]THA02965.1 FKBP-type peptidyl-prolyl cis-trans isomerase [Rodentibacter pneumotropicus]THA04782.1 FKBP-type peptidyl-prolyl cis-trans isomerase [Rodentibacter pneumotropicus]
MLKIQKISFAALMVSAVVSGAVFADGKADAKFNDDVSYALAAYSMTQAKLMAEQGEIKLNETQVSKAVEDVLKGKFAEEKIGELTQTLEQFQQKIVAREQAKMKEIAQKAQDEGDKYRAEFAKKEGVKTTKSGLLYRIVEAGKGEAIKPTDTVKVHYTGKLPNGEVFDSSVERGQPAEFRLDQVVKGWTEGLQLVKKGGKIELVLPPELAYGKQGAGASIPPNATLYFEVEVLDVNPKAK